MLAEPAPTAADDPAARRRLGAVYTPEPEVRLACSRALAAWLPGRSRSALADVAVCDPACGDGAFLAGYVAVAGVAPRLLVGVDADPSALVAAARRVPAAMLRHGDALVTAHGPFAWGTSAPARYDLVLGNPPFVRHQALTDPLQRDGAYAERLERALAAFAPGLRLSRRADLSAAFLALGVSLLAPGGVLAMVTASAWLDAAYGEPLGRHLLRAGLVEIVERRHERSFAGADVNSLIVVVRRGATGPVALRQLGGRTRVRRLARSRLAAEPKWGGRLLRAPSALPRLERALAAGPVLGACAAVGSYLVTGADGFFYLRREDAEALGLDPAVLRPVVKSTRGEHRLVLPAETRRVLFTCEDPAHRPGSPTAAYLARGAADGVPGRTGVRGRDPWCAIRQRPGAVLCVRTMRDRHLAYLNPHGLASGELYRVDPPAGVPPAALAAYLGSAVAGLQLEALGRAYGGGGGPLKVERRDLVQLRLPALAALREARGDLERALEPLRARPLGTVADERGRGDRNALEELCGALAGLSPDETAGVRDAHVAAVGARLARARRVLDTA